VFVGARWPDQGWQNLATFWSLFKKIKNWYHHCQWLIRILLKVQLEQLFFFFSLTFFYLFFFFFLPKEEISKFKIKGKKKVI
jgi:hypothetical protein